MTAAHVSVMAEIAAGGGPTREKTALAQEIAANIQSQVSGELITVERRLVERLEHDLQHHGYSEDAMLVQTVRGWLTR